MARAALPHLLRRVPRRRTRPSATSTSRRWIDARCRWSSWPSARVVAGSAVVDDRRTFVRPGAAACPTARARTAHARWLPIVATARRRARASLLAYYLYLSMSRTCPRGSPRRSRPCARVLRGQVRLRRRLRRLRRPRGRRAAASTCSGAAWTCGLIDGAVNGAAALVARAVALACGRVQTGLVRGYALLILGGRGGRRRLPAVVREVSRDRQLLTVARAPARSRARSCSPSSRRDAERRAEARRPRRVTLATFAALARCSSTGFQRRARACSSRCARRGCPRSASRYHVGVDGISALARDPHHLPHPDRAARLLDRDRPPREGVQHLHAAAGDGR